MDLVINQTDDVLVLHAGLALAGARWGRTHSHSRFNTNRLGERKRLEVPQGDIPAATIELLCLGKSSRVDIEALWDWVV